MAIEDPATVCDGAFEIGEGLEAQMIRHMRHGSSPRLMALQPIRVPDPGESPADSISRSSYYSIPTMVRPPLRRLQRSRRLTLSVPQPALQQSAARKCCPGGRERPRRQAPARSVLCAGHVQQPGGESPLCNLMEVKHERSARAEPRGTV